MRIIKLCIGAALAMLLVAAGFANAGVDDAGTTGANFLATGQGARILGMGGASLGWGDDLTASGWNAAALAWTNRTELAFSHAGLDNGGMQDWVALGGRFGSSNTRWGISGFYQGESGIEGRDATNNPTGSFGVSSMAFGAQLAHRFGDALSLGFGVKPVVEKLGDVTGLGTTFEGGLQFRKGIFGFGVAAQNMGGQMRYQGVPYRFPGSVGAGFAITHPDLGLRVAIDANFPMTYYSDVRTGVEWQYANMLAVRAGYRHELAGANTDIETLSGPSFGLGAGRNGFWFDYGYLISGANEAQHRIGMRFSPGGAMGGWLGSSSEEADVRPEPAKPAKRAAVEPEAAKKKTRVESKPTESAKVAPAPAAVESKVAPASESAKNEPATQATKQAVAPSAAKETPAAATKQVVAPSTAKETPAPATKQVVAPSTAKEAPAAATKQVVAPSTAKETPAPANQATKQAVTPSGKAAVSVKPSETAKASAPGPKPETAAPKPAEPKAEAKADAKAESKVHAKAESKVDAQPETKKEPEARPETKAPRPAQIKVKKGDTIASISREYGASIASIMMENNMTNETIKIGQTLKLPPSKK